MPKIIDYLTYKDKFYLSFVFRFFLVKYVKESKIFNNFVFKLNSIQIMKKLFFGALFMSVLFTSCISSKKYADLETQHNKTKQELVDAKADLQSCLVDKDHLMELNNSLKEDKARSLQQVENLTVLTQSSSDNIKEVIAQLSEKDKYINGVRDAMTKKDSINLALAFVTAVGAKIPPGTSLTLSACEPKSSTCTALSSLLALACPLTITRLGTDSLESVSIPPVILFSVRRYSRSI